MPMVENSQQVIKWLKLIVISSLLSVFCLEMPDLDIVIVQVMLQDLEGYSSLALTLLQLLAGALTQQH